MKSKHKLVLIVLGALAAGYGIYLLVKHSKEVAARALNDKAMTQFQKSLRQWTSAIKKAIKKELPGWESWHEPDPQKRPEKLAKAKSMALWQILQHEPHLIPSGYEITDPDGNGLQLVKI